MSETAKANDDAALELLFADARKYPLLTAQEEQTIDGDKWLALEQLQQLLVADQHCRNYMLLWASNTLDNPPSLEDFAIREHYYLLRREQLGLLEGGAQRPTLIRFRKRIAGPISTTRDRKAIAALQLPAGLMTGLAEILLVESAPRGVAAALQYWHGFWSARPDISPESIDADILIPLHETLARYYAAREQLVDHNLRLVFAIAGRLTGRGVPYRDLIQNGVIGLIRAAEKFEHQKGYRFSTYAYNWISQAVRHTIEDLRGIVRYPAGVNEQISRMHRERLFLLNTTGSDPDVPTLARCLKMKPDALRRLQQVGNRSVSLDASPSGETEGLALAETLAGGPFGATPDDAEQESLNRCLMQRIQILEPSEQRVVIRRWGLDQSPPLTRAEIAQQMAVSTEWVRQLEVSALAKLSTDETVAEAWRDHRETAG
jgi:RNA polymerase sigma factor (sigma-70 family)